jgi:type II secretory ATPase GspE/PulE/Tfp pilus assembly ATPase PilB-like protein
MPINPDYLKLIPFEDSEKAKIICFYKLGNKLRVAVTDPENEGTKRVLNTLKEQGYLLNVNLASNSGIIEVISKYKLEQKYKKKEIVEKVEERILKTYEKEIQELKEIEKKIPEVTAEEAVNLINIGAMKTKASDIHYEPEKENVDVRFRIDGILYKVLSIKPQVYANILGQIKYQTKMKLNVSDIPQDGRYSFNYNDRKIDVRVSIIPTETSESIVCRLLDSGKKFSSFEELGFDGEHLEKMKKLLDLSHGMILVTGPTGSGKTTTLYSLLSGFNTPDKKIITLENPIEYHIDGLVQSQVNEKGTYNFSDGLKAILRQDPDIVMIGEVRDLETASTCAQAALTGHVLLSTLHTNSAVESIPRLINMGLEPFVVAPSLDTVIAQRLVRRVCKKCGKLEAITEEEKKIFEQAFEELKKYSPDKIPQIPSQVYHAQGCEECSHTGYTGRLVIVEMLTVDDEIRELILSRSSAAKIKELARKKGFITMKEDGIRKVALGLTTFEEVQSEVTISGD